MTLSDTLELNNSHERTLVRVLQLSLACILVYGVLTIQLELALNAGFPLLITFFPAILRREYSYTIDAGLVLLITLAVFLHALGSLGLYVRYSWYDEVTHAVSAVLVVGIGYAVLTAPERHTQDISLTPKLRGAFILVFVLAFSVIWEVFEFGAVWVSQAVGVTSPVRVF